MPIYAGEPAVPPEHPAEGYGFWKKTLNTARKRLCIACTTFIFTYIYYILLKQNICERNEIFFSGKSNPPCSTQPLCPPRNDALHWGKAWPTGKARSPSPCCYWDSLGSSSRPPPRKEKVFASPSPPESVQSILYCSIIYPIPFPQCWERLGRPGGMGTGGGEGAV